MRERASAVELMLLATVVIWAFNVTVTKYVLTHGFRPLAYASVRYVGAALLSAAATYAFERSLRMDGRRAVLLLALATALLLANQLAFVYSLKLTDATTVSLILGTTPMFTALISSSLGVESLTPTFWIATVITFGGVALVALGNGGSLSADIVGDLIALALAATWGAYSVTITPLMETFSPYRISSVVLLAMGIPLVAISVPQLGAQDYGAPNTLSWLGLAYAIVGPLALTNILWFMAISRVGPARASLFANLQPFLGAVFALVLLSEDLGPLQVAGGFLIAGGVMLERRTHRAVAPVAE